MGKFEGASSDHLIIRGRILSLQQTTERQSLSLSLEANVEAGDGEIEGSDSDDEIAVSSIDCTSSCTLHFVSLRKMSASSSEENLVTDATEGENELLAVGRRGNRSYVVRNGKIGVFSPNENGRMEHNGTLTNIRYGTRGRTFNPKQVSLHLCYKSS